MVLLAIPGEKATTGDPVPLVTDDFDPVELVVLESEQVRPQRDMA